MTFLLSGISCFFLKTQTCPRLNIHINLHGKKCINLDTILQYLITSWSLLLCLHTENTQTFIYSKNIRCMPKKKKMSPCIQHLYFRNLICVLFFVYLLPYLTNAERLQMLLNCV